MANALPVPEMQDTALLLPDLELPDNIRIFARKDNEFTRAPANVNLRHFVLLVSLRGTAEVIIDDVAVVVRPGDALILFPDQYHRYRHPHGRLLWLFVSFLLKSDKALLPLKYAVLTLSTELWRHLMECLNAYGSSHRMMPYTGGRIVVELWQLLLGLLEQNKLTPFLPPDEQPTSSEKYRLIVEAQQYIMENVDKPIGVNDVALRLGMSVTAVQMLFKKHLSRGAGEIIRRMRIANATHLIGSTDAPFKQIAAKCGFSSVHVFSRTFKRLAGRSPMEYRKLLRRIHAKKKGDGNGRK